jgi:hypothetical protein
MINGNRKVGGGAGKGKIVAEKLAIEILTKT